MTSLLPFFKALADESRLRLIQVLMLGSFNVGELCEMLELGQSRVSRHLKILADAGLLASRREGTWVYYRLPRDAGPVTSSLLGWLREQGGGQAEDHRRALEALERRALRSRSYFEDVAPRWSEVKRRFLGDGAYLAELETELPGCPVLVDVGSGTGDLLLGRRGRHEQLIGVDRSARMIAEAERRRDAAGAANIEFRLGSAEHLPLADGEAQAAIVNMVLHYVADPAAALREVGRALTPGGTVVVADLEAHSQDWMRDELNHQWLGFEPGDLEGWLAAAGFEDVRTRTRAASPGGPNVLLATGRRP